MFIKVPSQNKLHHQKCIQPKPNNQQAPSKLEVNNVHNLQTNKCEENKNNNKVLNSPSPSTIHKLVILYFWQLTTSSIIIRISSHQLSSHHH
jgi:hypothetical protein